jgi:hypothetical protein
MPEKDEELVRQIHAHADQAEAAKPNQMDIGALATVLGAHFDHRSIEEIKEKIKDIWRARGLHWRN